MKLRLCSIALCTFLAPAACLAKTILPDACGDPSVKFSVHTEKDQPAPAPPAQEKAQVILIEDQNARYKSFEHATVRYGVDGNWVGANNGDSYFALSVDPEFITSAPIGRATSAEWQLLRSLQRAVRSIIFKPRLP